jgi:hypothetical protein
MPSAGSPSLRSWFNSVVGITQRNPLDVRFTNDSSASFSVFSGNDDFEHWKCFAGCGQGDAI